MVYFAMPDVPPQSVVLEQVAAAPVSRVPAVRKMTYGVCELFFATEDERSASSDSSINSFSASSYAIDFLRPVLREMLSTPYGATGETLEWYGKWLSSLKVTILRAPEHGKFVNLENDPNNEYLPNLGYVGKDRVDLLVEGKDDRGRSFFLVLKYFINVLPSGELHGHIVKGKGAFSEVVKKLCGTSKNYWRISDDHYSYK